MLQTQGMERLERLTMHMQEALRLRQADHLESQRLSLILLDSAVELMMHRKCQELLHYEDFDFRELENIERLQRWKPEEYKTPEFDERLDELRGRTTSRSKRADIWRDFSAKIDFLTRAEEVGPPHSQILERLHAYRNEAYHRDQIRPDTLGSAVEIYVVVACHLMATLTPGTIINGHTGLPPTSLAHFEAEFRASSDVFDIQPAIARAFLRDAGLSTVRDLTEALHLHVEDRLDAVEDVLGELSDAWGDRGWTPATVLISLQLEDTPNNAFLGPTQVTSRRVPFHLKDIKRWRKLAAQMLESPDALSAFAIFAQFEEEFEQVEARAMSAMRAYEEYVDNEIRRARGG